MARTNTRETVERTTGCFVGPEGPEVMSASTTRPHYVRFARALALASVVATASGCCPMVPDATACGHCACSLRERSLSAPLLCETIHREDACCRAFIIGPLSPPDLPIA